MKFLWARWKDCLAKLNEEGRSAAEMAYIIGKDAGRPISRNMVMGALHRYGFRSEYGALFWTPDRISYLRIAWRAGRSAAQIAEHFGITDQAVRDQAKKLKLPSPEMHQSVQARIERSAAKMKSRPLPRLPPLSTETKEFISAKPIPLSELDEHASNPSRCRWIVTELPRYAEHLYCGEKTIEGFPYCAHHARKAYGRTAAEMVEAASEKLRRG